jgi:biotin carboxyl carrier protein
MKFEAVFEKESKVLFFYEQSGKYFFKDDQKSISEVFIRKVGNSQFYSLDKVTWSKLPVLIKAKHVISIENRFEVFRGFRPSGNIGFDESLITSQMPGKVVKINVKAGQEVSKGETLIILEAMKMENELKSGLNAIVKSINITEGQSIESGHLMLELEAIE